MKAHADSIGRGALLASALLAAGLVATLTACAAPRARPVFPSPRVQMRDDLLARDIVVDEVRERRRDEVLEVFITVVNKTTAQQDLQARVSWTDVDGYPVAETPWIRHLLRSASRDTWQVTALSPAAVDFRIDIRRASD